jgi:aspartate aminotransferase
MVTSSPEERERVLSQIKRVIRPLYSSPPMHGAQLVATILGTPELYKQWYVCSSCPRFKNSSTFLGRTPLTCRLAEVKKMADRIISMREQLYNKLIELKTPGEWGHIKSQIGEL